MGEGPVINYGEGGYIKVSGSFTGYEFGFFFTGPDGNLPE